jgi:hypothetical protein
MVKSIVFSTQTRHFYYYFISIYDSNDSILLFCIDKKVIFSENKIFVGLSSVLGIQHTDYFRFDYSFEPSMYFK